MTTDSCLAANGLVCTAVAVHWTSNNWIQDSKILDVISLYEPIHSREYLARQMLTVTNDYKIRNGVFTITRDNVSDKSTMLAQYEIGACESLTTIDQPWTFTVKEGDMRCMAHVINSAVRAALSSRKSVPSEEQESYRVHENYT